MLIATEIKSTCYVIYVGPTCVSGCLEYTVSGSVEGNIQVDGAYTLSTDYCPGEGLFESGEGSFLYEHNPGSLWWEVAVSTEACSLNR